MNDLKVYLAVFAAHENKQWRIYKTHLIAKSTANAISHLVLKYKQIQIYTLEEIKLEEGMFL